MFCILAFWGPPDIGYRGRPPYIVRAIACLTPFPAEFIKIIPKKTIFKPYVLHMFQTNSKNHVFF